MDTTSASKLTVIKSVKDKKFVIVRPGIVATYYIDDAMTKAASSVAAAIPRYLKFVGPDAIRSYVAQNGTYKQFSKERLERDVKVFRSVAANAPGPDLEYSSELNGSVGDYGISVRGVDNDDTVFPLAVTLLRFEFPPEAVATATATTRLLEFALSEAVALGAQSGIVGWGFKRAVPFPQEATAEINAKLPRYLGFEPCYNGFGMQMRDKTPSAQWVTFLDKALFAKCGGEKRLREVAPSVRVEHEKGTFLLRGAKMPPVGDANQGAKDIGALPEIARFLKPRRVSIGGLGDKKLDAAAWLARFDELPPREWENG